MNNWTTPKKAINSELKKVQFEKKTLLREFESLQGEPSLPLWQASSCEGANGRNPERGLGKTSHLPARQAGSAWRVLKVAFLFPVLGRSLSRDLSPLPPLLVEGTWNRVRSRLAPLEVEGASLQGDF